MVEPRRFPRGNPAASARVAGGRKIIMKPITRRNMLAKTAWVGTSAASGLAMTERANAAESATKPTKKLKLIVTGGHPGDPEYGCGGTIARYTGAGHEVVLLYLNEGEPRGNPARLASGTRVEEARKACQILKARPAFAGQIDGEAVVDRENY